MSEITLIIGGCKSGKSRHALMLARQTPVKHRKFIATGVPFDTEMEDRIRRHRKERGAEWETIEAPVDLIPAIAENGGFDTLILVDCITLWINNLLMENRDRDEIIRYGNELVKILNAVEGPVLLVSNEVGAGIVPENPLARRFRDIAGVINGKIAGCAHQVIWMVAGIPVRIKGLPCSKG